MAAPKKKTGLVKRKALSPAQIKEQVQKDIEALKQKTTAGEGKTISIRNKVFTLPDGTILQPPQEFVIIDFLTRNLYYDTKWDPDNPQPPACFAIGDTPNGLVPSPNSPDKQNDDCDTCPMNQFGSDGEGKACKNTRYVAVVLPGQEEVMTMSLPPTSIRAFDAYVNSVAKLYNVPPIGVVSTVSFHPEKSYPLPLFSDPKPNDDVAMHYALREEARELLMQEPNLEATADAKPKKAKKKAVRRRA